MRLMIFVCAWTTLIGLQFDENLISGDTFIESFRRDPLFARNLDPTSHEEGTDYAREILFHHQNIMDQLSLLKENDLVGDPVLKSYPQFGRISASTLRFIKTAADIRSYFGDLEGLRILHIGAGYGGVVKILNAIAKPGDYTVLQHASVNRIAEKYLSALGVVGIQFVDDIGQLDLASYDLVIVDGDFSGPFASPSVLAQLIEKVPRGFLLKRGAFDHFDKWIASLIRLGKKGKLQGDLYSDENIRFGLFWRPLNDYNPTKILTKAPLYPLIGFQPDIAITNGVTKNRLGDQLLTYFKALWLARTTQHPFLFTSFKYSDAFVLSEMDPPAGSPFLFKNYRQYIDDLSSAKLSTLFTVPFTPEARRDWSTFAPYMHSIVVDWEDQEFQKLIKESLQLKIPTAEIHPPEGVISVAIHYRDGGSFENYSLLSNALPLKFSNSEWIVQQLQRIRRIFPNEKLYVYIFTDHKNPAMVASTIQASWGDANTEIDWEKNSELSANVRVLSDFQSFKNFDCLIRSNSHFSFIAGKLGQYKLEIWPVHEHLEGKKNHVIDQSAIKFGQ